MRATAQPPGPTPTALMFCAFVSMLLLVTACSAGEPGDPSGTGGASNVGGSGGSGFGGATAVCDAPNMVFKPTCGGAVCHVTDGVFPPVLDTADPTAALVGKPALGVAPCTGMPLVNAADPPSSVILTRIKGTACGEQMPSNIDNPPTRRLLLTQSQIDCVTAWVMSKKQ